MTAMPETDLIERLNEGTRGTDITKTDVYLCALMREAATALSEKDRRIVELENDIRIGCANIDRADAENATLRARLASCEAESEQMRGWLQYWIDGDDIIQSCLKKREAGNPEDAPFPLVGDDAVNWLAAQADAYRHAIEMMGVPSTSGPGIRAALTKGGEEHA